MTQARESYETAGLLRTIGELDELMTAARREDGLADMFAPALHGAYGDQRGAPMDVATDEETLPELAQDLIIELHGVIARLRAWVHAMAARDWRGRRRNACGRACVSF
ncbi:MAG: hypothetical protein H7255_17880 [Ramlibacter sp.]|nr:hypothetical protein [Ramlibacter sp.]